MIGGNRSSFPIFPVFSKGLKGHQTIFKYAFGDLKKALYNEFDGHAIRKGIPLNSIKFYEII